MRNPALDDPRANTPRPSYGERMAKELGTDLTLREERLTPAWIRTRRGKECYEIQQARTAQLNAFDENMRQTPALVSACK